MPSHSPNPWTLRGVIFIIWALVAAAAAYWGLKLVARPAGVPVAAPQRVAAAPDPAAVARLLGSTPQAVSAAPVVSLASRFALIGVVAGSSKAGAALIAVDGKPPKPFRVGSAVDEGLLLQAVEGRRAVLGATTNGPPVLTLEMPALRR